MFRVAFFGALKLVVFVAVLKSVLFIGWSQLNISNLSTNAELCGQQHLENLQCHSRSWPLQFTQSAIIICHVGTLYLIWRRPWNEDIHVGLISMAASGIRVNPQSGIKDA